MIAVEVAQVGSAAADLAAQPALDIAVPEIVTAAATVRNRPTRHMPHASARAAKLALPSSQTGASPSEAIALVAEFHSAFGLPSRFRPTAPLPAELAQLRVDLLTEEVGEFTAASTTQDIVGIADALADIVYVAYGTAITYGIDLDAILREVHRSNMSKLDEDGKPIYRRDGKVMKSEHYVPPDVAGILGVQSPLPL